MSGLFRFCVLWALAAAVIAGASAQSILDGEFGAAKKPVNPPVKTAPAKPRGVGNIGIQAASPKPSTPAAKTSEPTTPVSGKRYPFHGQFDRVSENGESIVLAGKTKERVILITSRTNITRDGRRVSVKEAMKGERVTGSVVKNAEGREQALTLRLRGLQ